MYFSPSLVQQPNASSETKPLVPRTKAPTKVKVKIVVTVQRYILKI